MSVRQPSRRDKNEDEEEGSSSSASDQSTAQQKTEAGSPKSTKRTKSAESIDDWLDTFDPATPTQSGTKSEVSQNQSRQTAQSGSEQQVQQAQLDSLLSQFVKELPSWINKPWMYVKPSHEGHLTSWYQSWKNLILKYTETLSQHIINIYDLREIHPFTHHSSGKNLSAQQVQYIIDEMVDENLAKWLDDDSIRARIYYQTDREWADMIYQFTLDEGYALDIMTFYELQNLDQSWSTLPDSELRSILSLLVAEKKAEWIGSDKDTIQFKVV